MNEKDNIELKEVNERLNGMERNVSEMGSDVKDIRIALLGNEYNPNSLIKRIETLEVFKSKVEVKIFKAQVIGFFVGAIIEFIYKGVTILQAMHK